MTVNELIEKLKEMPEDMQVYGYHDTIKSVYVYDVPFTNGTVKGVNLDDGC